MVPTIDQKYIKAWEDCKYAALGRLPRAEWELFTQYITPTQLVAFDPTIPRATIYATNAIEWVNSAIGRFTPVRTQQFSIDKSVFTEIIFY